MIELKKTLKKEDREKLMKSVETITEILYMICVYQSTVRIKIITFQNTIPCSCELLEEFDIDTENFFKNVSLPTRAASNLLTNLKGGEEHIN